MGRTPALRPDAYDARVNRRVRRWRTAQKYDGRAAMGRMAASALVVLVVSGFAGSSNARGEGAAQVELRRALGSPSAPRVEPASAPSEGSSGGEFEGRPGRDDPDQFYKKPPRKPKLRSRMFA